ncbi:MAG TPA: SAM-dependent methyltransferase, partial [Betaproteobacteria bacterium]|nr:SAM-dependent methyltransferase [Betaproteobacteria bacterium]
MEALNPKLFDAAVTATTEILKFTSPSDSILSNYFKTNRELGGRERPVIA